MVTQHQFQCQQHGPLSEPALTVTSINIEGMSAAKQQLLEELCEKQKCDVLCVQETHRGLKAIRPNSIAHLAEKDVMDAIPKTQHRPISIKLNAAIRLRNGPFRRRYNLKKAKWQSYAKEVDNGIANTNPVPENYEKFVNLVRRSSNKNIPRGCRTSYVCGLNDQSKDMYED